MGPFAVSAVGLASFFAVVLGATKGINDPWEWWAIVAVAVTLAAVWQFHRLRCARDAARLKPMIEQHRDEAVSLIERCKLVPQGDDTAYQAWQDDAGHFLGDIEVPFAVTLERHLGRRYGKPFQDTASEVAIARSQLHGTYRYNSGFGDRVERAWWLLSQLIPELDVPRSIFRPMDTPFTR
jgi:hypothetical protein